jgi:type I restriction enzyme M protein
MDNTKIINQINQLFHNKGVRQEERFNALIGLLENKNEQNKYKDIYELLNSLDYNNKELIQELFMLIGSKYTKYNLDQFYSPLTISKFISSFMMNDRTAIDPAGGTGDLLLYYNGNKTIWDIDENALKLCKFNYELNKQKNYNLVCKNSLEDFEDSLKKYDYVVMNPPFGSSTVITESTILNKFILGKGKKKQEIGILFLELGLKLLKDDGLLFIIVPSGYVGNGNKNCEEMRSIILENRLIASINLPENTFKRSGTGVNTYLLVIQKKEIKMESYTIFISKIDNIGYNLSKKDTPLKYKIVKETGDIITDSEGKKVLDNDLEQLKEQIDCFVNQNNIKEINVKSHSLREYEEIGSDMLTETILDVKRYLRTYLDIVEKMKKNNATTVSKLGKILNKTSKIEKTKQYKYIDISEITSPLYSHKALYGWELPSRAKYEVKKYDILVSKLEGTMSYCVILNDDNNYIVTNGVCVIRPNDMNSLYILFANIMSRDFVVQREAFLTGSIMASLADTDIEGLYIDKNVDIEGTKKIIETLETLQKLRN